MPLMRRTNFLCAQWRGLSLSLARSSLDRTIFQLLKSHSRSVYYESLKYALANFQRELRMLIIFLDSLRPILEQDSIIVFEDPAFA